MSSSVGSTEYHTAQCRLSWVEWIVEGDRLVRALYVRCSGECLREGGES